MAWMDDEVDDIKSMSSIGQMQVTWLESEAMIGQLPATLWQIKVKLCV